MASNSNLSLSNETQSNVALMQEYLSELTGEEKMQLAHLSEDELLTQLSFCLECQKEDLLNLFLSHDQNQIENMVTVANLWKQVKRGVVRTTKSVFANLPGKILENIHFQNHEKIKAVKASELNFANNKHSARSDSLTSDWNKIILNTAPKSMVDKVEASRAMNDNIASGMKSGG